MMTYQQWVQENALNLNPYLQRAGYENYFNHTVENLESTIGELRADKVAAHAVCDEVRKVLLDAMGDAGLPTYEEGGPVPQVLDVARAAAVAIRLMAGCAS